MCTVAPDRFEPFRWDVRADPPPRTAVRSNACLMSTTTHRQKRDTFEDLFESVSPGLYGDRVCGGVPANVRCGRGHGRGSGCRGNGPGVVRARATGRPAWW